MGICGLSNSTNTIIVAAKETPKLVNHNITNSTGKMKDEKELFVFANFEEYKSILSLQTKNALDGRMIGEGVKEIPSYKCIIPFDELKALREKFWKSKLDSKRGRWKVLKEICETDAASAVKLLEAAGLVCKDNLCTILELDDPDIIYNVPNFCVADPVFERNYEELEKNTALGQSKDISIICYCSLTNTEIVIDTNTHTTGKVFKELFSVKASYPLDKYKLRLFYSGQEIQDDHFLSYHNLSDSSKLQVMVINLD